MVERAVGQASEIGGCFSRECCDVSAGELLFGGAALLATAAFGLAA
jgi:hypothetical protein